MASRKGYGRRGSNRLADMSLPAETRRKPKRHKAGKRKTAQMDHATSPAAQRKRRDGERAMERKRLAADALDADGQRVTSRSASAS